MSKGKEQRPPPRVAGQYAATEGKQFFRVGPWREGDPGPICEGRHSWRLTEWRGVHVVASWYCCGLHAPQTIALIMLRAVAGYDLAAKWATDFAATVLWTLPSGVVQLPASTVENWVKTMEECGVIPGVEVTHERTQ